MFKKIQKWWYLKVRNTKVREGETGAFRWVFKRYSMEISTLSENFKASWTADAHPYGYLLAGKGDENIHGFAERIYMVSKLLTTDQKFVSDIDKAIKNYEKRLTKAEGMKEDETEEKIALEEVKQVQEVVEMDKKTRKKYEKDVNKRFKEAVKKADGIRG